MSKELMPDLKPYTCIVCVRQVNPLSDNAEGWVPFNRSVDDGDRSDDPGWLCPDHATGLDTD